MTKWTAVMSEIPPVMRNENTRNFISTRFAQQKSRRCWKERWSDWVGLGYGVDRVGGGSEREGVRKGKGAEVLDTCKNASIRMFFPVNFVQLHRLPTCSEFR
jgi:hypothetical protein